MGTWYQNAGNKVKRHLTLTGPQFLMRVLFFWEIACFSDKFPPVHT